MISNPNLVLYACIAKGTTILVQFSSKQPDDDIESLALKCLQKTPPHHTKFSHTIHKRTYTFFIDDPIVYFAIFDEKLDNSESSWFLNRAKSNFERLMATGSMLSFDDMVSGCFQSHVGEIFCELLFPLDTKLEKSMSKHSRNSSGESSGGKKKGLSPLLGKEIKVALKKKTRLYGEANGCSRDFSVDNKVEVNEMHKNGGNYPGDRQKAKQVWKKHVWVVLTLDVLVCAILFGIWLWICRGFQCIDG